MVKKRYGTIEIRSYYIFHSVFLHTLSNLMANIGVWTVPSRKADHRYIYWDQILLFEVWFS